MQAQKKAGRQPKRRRSGGCVVETPVAMVIPMRPVFDPESKSPNLIVNPKAVRFESAPTSVASVDHFMEDLVAGFRQRYDAGDEAAIFEMLDLDTNFATIPWVHDAAIQLLRKQRPRRRGRPSGGSRETAARCCLVEAVVDHLCSVNGWSKDKAFGRLQRALSESVGTNTPPLTYESIQRLYYRAKAEPRLKAMLFRRMDSSVVRRAEDAFETPIDLAEARAVVVRIESVDSQPGPDGGVQGRAVAERLNLGAAVTKERAKRRKNARRRQKEKALPTRVPRRRERRIS